jgi:hypothetical protein
MACCGDTPTLEILANRPMTGRKRPADRASVSPALRIADGEATAEEWKDF